MKTQIPIYITKLINKYPLILSGRKKIKENHLRIVKTKKLIKEFTLKNKKIN